MGNSHVKPGSPGDILEHYGVKGMRWGVVNEDDESPDHPSSKKPEKKGLSREQKMLLTFGVATAAAAGYVAYRQYAAGQAKLLTASLPTQEAQQIGGITLPKSWDVRGLKKGPISTTPLGQIGGGNWNTKLLNPDNLVVNTARGYADFVPKDGFKTAFAAEQHRSVIQTLEEMRKKYPSIRNLNVEVVPFSHAPGQQRSKAFMSVVAMRAGEARIMYNDMVDEPSAGRIAANADFLPGLGKKNYLAYHEMGHLLAVANGDMPPAYSVVSGEAGYNYLQKFKKAGPMLHERTFAKHGFTFEELSKLSKYGATEPAEAMAELAGHFHHPEMRKRLTPDQIKRAEAMFNDMGGRK